MGELARADGAGLAGLAAAMLWALATEPAGGCRSFFLQAIIVATFVSSAMVLYATKAHHPGWAGLLGVAVLTYLDL